jgi:hypothetical protein
LLVDFVGTFIVGAPEGTLALAEPARRGRN